MTDTDVIKKYYALKSSAKTRGLEFNLSLVSIKNLLNAKRCYYTKARLTKENRSIDRIDNTKGYVKGNVCACTVRINQLKSNMTFKEIESIYKRVKRHAI